jgi:hypothetical protein
MAKNQPLYEYIGDPIAVIAPSTHSSDGVSASDNAAGVPIIGMDGVLFIELLGATDATDVSQIQIQYSSTGNASDAASSAAGWTCTDAIFTIHPHASSPLLSMLDFRISAKSGLADGAGKLYATMAAAETGAAIHSLIGIPYGGTRLLPATNAVTVVHAQA